MVIAPRAFGQVLGDGVSSLARAWRALLTPALVASVPVSIATVAAFRITGGAEFIDIAFNHPERLQTLSSDVLWELARPFFVAVGIAAVFQTVASVFIALVSHLAVASDLSGGRIEPRAVSRVALARFPTALGAVLIVLAVVVVLFGIGLVVWLAPIVAVGTPNPAALLVALLLFVVLLGPGIWMTVSASMTTAAVAIDRLGPLASILHSVRLVKGRWWPTAGYLLLVGLLGGIATQLIQLIALPLAALGDAGTAVSVASALGIVAQGLLIAGITALYTHWYVDLRARKGMLSTDDLR
jgi:hypothetical protein